MNSNCNRDPMTCRCLYHSGYVAPEPPPRAPIAPRLPEPWKPTEAQMLEAAGITRSATGSCDVCHGSGENWWDQLWPESPCRICGGSGLIYAESGLPAPRPPIAPGLLLEDDEARVYVSRGVLRIVARWAVGLGMIVTGAAVMFAEGQLQAQPGPGFAVGLAFIVGAAFVVARR